MFERQEREKLDALRDELVKLDRRRGELVAEIQQIQNGIAAEQSPDSSEVNIHSPEAEKIRYFGSCLPGETTYFRFGLIAGRAVAPAISLPVKTNGGPESAESRR